MACLDVPIQTILGTECIGDSLPKIMGNFNTLGDATCDLITRVNALSSSVTSLSSTKANNLSVVDSPTIDLSYNSITGTLSANVTTSYLISSNFTGTNQSLTTSGFQKLPGGLIIQWGRVSYADIGISLQIPVTFPISFPTSTSPIVIAISDTGQFAVSCTVNNRTSTGVNIVVREYDTTIASGTVLYITMGY